MKLRFAQCPSKTANQIIVCVFVATPWEVLRPPTQSIGNSCLGAQQNCQAIPHETVGQVIQKRFSGLYQIVQDLFKTRGVWTFRELHFPVGQSVLREAHKGMSNVGGEAQAPMRPRVKLML